MLNTSNVCMFEGRFTKDPELKYVGKNNTEKVIFSLACDRTIKSEDKGNQNIVSADFPTFVAIGKQADIIAKYFVKGKPIRLIASFQTYLKTKKNPQDKDEYGNIFKVEQLNFVLSDNTNNNNGNYNNNNGNYNNKNYNGGNNNNNDSGWQDDMIPVDDADMPF